MIDSLVSNLESEDASAIWDEPARWRELFLNPWKDAKL